MVSMGCLVYIGIIVWNDCALLWALTFMSFGNRILEALAFIVFLKLNIWIFSFKSHWALTFIVFWKSNFRGIGFYYLLEIEYLNFSFKSHESNLQNRIKFWNENFEAFSFQIRILKAEDEDEKNSMWRAFAQRLRVGRSSTEAQSARELWHQTGKKRLSTMAFPLAEVNHAPRSYGPSFCIPDA